MAVALTLVDRSKYSQCSDARDHLLGMRRLGGRTEATAATGGVRLCDTQPEGAAPSSELTTWRRSQVQSSCCQFALEESPTVAT